MERRSFINRGQRLSPSARKIIKLRQRAFNSGGASLELQTPTNYIRDISRKLNYDITSDASLIMTPNTIGEGRLFNCKPEIKNLILNSGDLSQSTWTKFNSTITSNAVVNPNSSTSYYVSDNTTTNSHECYTNFFNFTSGLVYTTTLFVTKADDDWVQFIPGSAAFGSTAYINFNLNTGAFGNNSGYSSFLSVNMGSGWWKVILSITATATANSIAVDISGTNNTNSIRSLVYLGTGRKYVNFGGAQCETGSTPTTYQRTTDGIIDFQATRATTANVIRKDGSIGDSCYNLVQRSEEFDNATWTKDTPASITPNLYIAPNGTMTADKMFVNTNTFTGTCRIVILPNTIAGTTYNYSIYVKKVELNYLMVRCASGSNLGFTVNLNNAAITQGYFDTTNASTFPPTYSATMLANGWIYVQYSFVAGISSSSLYFYLSDTVNTTGMTNLSGSGVAIWGAQLVQGSQPKDYLRTTNRLAVPSIDYSLGSSLPALLVERAATNTILWSQDFSNISYTKTNCSITNNTVLSPSGSIDGSTFTVSANGASNLKVNSGVGIVTTIGGQYTLSVYLKAGSKSLFQLGIPVNHLPAASFVNFDLASGTVGTISANIDRAMITPTTSGFYRCSVTFTATKNASDFVYLMAIDSISSGYAFAIPVTVGTYFIYGVQFETGGYPSSYLPTTTAAVTRNAYTSYVDLWNNSLLNKDNFTLYFEGYLQSNATTNVMVALSDTTGTGARANDLGVFDGCKATYAVGSTVTSDTVNLANETSFKIAVVRDGTSVKFFRNGAQIWSTQTIATFDYRYLVVNNGGSTYSLKKIALWKHTKSDAECVLITT